jgi:hypothetical protein
LIADKTKIKINQLKELNVWQLKLIVLDIQE